MGTTEKVSAAELAGLPLFEGLELSDLGPLALRSVRRSLTDGETLVELGEPISEVHWLEKGQIGLARSPREPLGAHLDLSHAGDLLGWSALREDPTALSTARAIGPA